MTDDELRAEVRKWLADNWNPDIDRGSWAHIVVDAGWATPSWEPEFYGRGLTDAQSRLVAAEFAAVGAHGCGHDRGNLFACTLHERGYRGAEATADSAVDPRREQMVPALQRARRGLGSGRRADPGRPRRRRVGHQRPEGVDVVRQDGRLRHAGGPDRLGCAEASRHQLLHAADETARRRGPADPPDHRRVGIQRGLHRGRPGVRRRTWSAS